MTTQAAWPPAQASAVVESLRRGRPVVAAAMTVPLIIPPVVTAAGAIPPVAHQLDDLRCVNYYSSQHFKLWCQLVLSVIVQVFSLLGPSCPCKFC